MIKVQPHLHVVNMYSVGNLFNFKHLLLPTITSAHTYIR